MTNEIIADTSLNHISIVIQLSVLFLLSPFIPSSLGAEVLEQNILTICAGEFCVMITFLIPLSQKKGLATLQILSIHKDCAIIFFYFSLICVVLGYVFSLLYGPMGVFFAAAISLTLGQCVMITLNYQRKASLHMGQFFRQTYLPMIIPMVILSALGAVIPFIISIYDWSDFVITVACHGTTCTALLWGLYLNKKERNMFVASLKKLLHTS